MQPATTGYGARPARATAYPRQRSHLPDETGPPGERGRPGDTGALHERDESHRAEAEPIELLIVDDHRIFAEVLATHLRLEPEVGRVEVAFSLDEAKVVLRSFTPGVVLLDHGVNGVPGVELIPELELLDPTPHVVMVSAAGDSDTIIEALAAGAEAWVGKDARFEVLMLATREVMAGRYYLHPPLLKPVLQRLLHGHTTPTAPSFLDTLTPRELEVLRCLVSGMTRNEVARRLFISPNTVRTHVQHLLQRAEVHSTVALVAAARTLGVRGVDDPETPLRPHS